MRSNGAKGTLPLVGRAGWGESRSAPLDRGHRHWRQTMRRWARCARRFRSAASSTSSFCMTNATRRPRRFADVSASACGPDQRTFENGGCARCRGARPTSQYPPSPAGPNTASDCRKARKAAAMSRARIPGISAPMMMRGPASLPVALARAMRCPRSPRPCDMRRTWRANMRLTHAPSGDTHSTVCQRGSRARCCVVSARLDRRNAVAAVVPTSRASRVFTRPATGSLTMMTRRGAKRGAPLGRLTATWRAEVRAHNAGRSARRECRRSKPLGTTDCVAFGRGSHRVGSARRT